MKKIIGFSGSTVKGGTLERAMEKVLQATGFEWELIRLSSKNIKYCSGCVGCAKTNKCVFNDDMQEVLEKFLKADAVVFGGIARHGGLNALTKNFLERFSPLFHQKMLSKGKPAAIVSGGLFHQENVYEDISHFIKTFQMEEVGAVGVGGNASCYKCGFGETCEYSTFRSIYGDEAKISDDVFYKFESDEETVEKAIKLGQMIARKIDKKVKKDLVENNNE